MYVYTSNIAHLDINYFGSVIYIYIYININKNPKQHINIFQNCEFSSTTDDHSPYT